MRLVRSPLLPAVHGFSTRQGGVSTGRYASLNVGARWGDTEGNVQENRRRLASDGGFALQQLICARQVHGATLLRIDGRSAEELANREADALIATDPGRAVGVYTADCVPLLMADGRGRVAAVHAGWRGTVARIAVAALEGLLEIGAHKRDFRVALGPAIGPCCFEVGEEVAAQFEHLPGAVARSPSARPHVDLRRANLELLLGAGLSREQIDLAAPCTMCERERFFSFRRDGGQIGQMLSFIVAG